MSVGKVSQVIGAVVDVDFGTGDLEFDVVLENMNINANLDLETFKAELRIEYCISDSQWDRMTATLEMEPAEVDLTAELSRISDWPIEKVVEVWQNERSRDQRGLKP